LKDSLDSIKSVDSPKTTEKKFYWGGCVTRRNASLVVLPLGQKKHTHSENDVESIDSVLKIIIINKHTVCLFFLVRIWQLAVNKISTNKIW
jgi:hypothetical protein